VLLLEISGERERERSANGRSLFAAESAAPCREIRGFCRCPASFLGIFSHYTIKRQSIQVKRRTQIRRRREILRREAFEQQYLPENLAADIFRAKARMF